jgi:MFS family permease
MALATQSGGFLTLLKKRNFLRLWLAQLLSTTIFNASNYAIVILTESLTHSATLIGLAFICFNLPAVLLSGPAGVFVDRLDKRRVLWGSNILRAIATSIFVLILLSDRHLLLIPIYLLTFCISAISQFFTPAEGSTIPLLVSEEELMPALSLFNITFMLSYALGFVFLGPIGLSLLPGIHLQHLHFDSLAMLHILIVVLYLICAGLILLIPPSSFTQQTPASSAEDSMGKQTLGIIRNIWNEMREGWNFVHCNKHLLLAVIQLSFAGILILVIGQLATPIVTTLLQLPANMMALLFAPAGIGLVLGSILMPRITLRLSKARAILLGTIVLSLATVLLPSIIQLMYFLQPQNWQANPLLLMLLALIMFAAGFALDLINIPAQTAIQEMTPEWIKGRVLSLQLMLYNTCSIPILLAIGALTDLFNLQVVLYLLSICEIGFGVWGISYYKKHLPGLSFTELQKIQTPENSDTIGKRSPQLH